MARISKDGGKTVVAIDDSIVDLFVKDGWTLLDGTTTSQNDDTDVLSDTTEEISTKDKKSLKFKNKKGE